MPPELTAALALCRNLPSPPGIALRIIELAQDPETDITTAADVIAIDMALSARMLQAPPGPYRNYPQRLADYNCAFIAQLHNSTTPAQRQAASERLASWEDDLRALALQKPPTRIEAAP